MDEKLFFSRKNNDRWRRQSDNSPLSHLHNQTEKKRGKNENCHGSAMAPRSQHTDTHTHGVNLFRLNVPASDHETVARRITTGHMWRPRTQDQRRDYWAGRSDSGDGTHETQSEITPISLSSGETSEETKRRWHFSNTFTVRGCTTFRAKCSLGDFTLTLWRWAVRKLGSFKSILDLWNVRMPKKSVVIVHTQSSSQASDLGTAQCNRVAPAFLKNERCEKHGVVHMRCDVLYVK